MNESLIILKQKKKCYFGLYFLFSSACSFSSAIVAPFASAGIRPVVNRLNLDMTVYYGHVFCAFSWPYMVKWHNSGIIKYLHYVVLVLLIDVFSPSAVNFSFGSLSTNSKYLLSQNASWNDFRGSSVQALPLPSRVFLSNACSFLRRQRRLADNWLICRLCAQCMIYNNNINSGSLRRFVVVFVKTIYNKTIISFGFCDILNNHKVLVSLSVISSVFGSAIYTYLDLDYSEYHKNPHPIIV